MKILLIIALAIYYIAQIWFLASMNGDYGHLTVWNLLRPVGIAVCAVRYFRGRITSALWVSIWSGGGMIRMLMAPPAGTLGIIEGVTELFLCIAGILAWKIPFFKPKEFAPNFPIIPLFATEEEAILLLRRHGTVTEEDPEKDKTIAHKLLVAESKDTRIAVGIWDGRVRFVNYLTDIFNSTEDLRGRKLGWFVKYYGGQDEFDEPADTGYMIWWRNPKRKLLILFGLHLGPVRIIDEDPAHWPKRNEN